MISYFNIRLFFAIAFYVVFSIATFLLKDLQGLVWQPVQNNLNSDSIAFCLLAIFLYCVFFVIILLAVWNIHHTDANLILILFFYWYKLYFMGLINLQSNQEELVSSFLLLQYLINRFIMAVWFQYILHMQTILYFIENLHY